MPEPLPEHQKTQLIVRSPLSTEGFVSIYFSSPEGRLMSEEEWWNLKQLIELGFDRLLFPLPPAPRDTVMPMIDNYAKVMAKVR